MEPESAGGLWLVLGRCRLCYLESAGALDLFSQEAQDLGIQEKAQKCLPILISEDDELSKIVCHACLEKLDLVHAFFQACFKANQEQVIALRKHGSNHSLDLTSHVLLFVRRFENPLEGCWLPGPQQIEAEPGMSPCSKEKSPGHQDLAQPSGQAQGSFNDSGVNKGQHRKPVVHQADELGSRSPKSQARNGSEAEVAEFCSTCDAWFCDFPALLAHVRDEHPDGEGSNRAKGSNQGELFVQAGICELESTSRVKMRQSNGLKRGSPKKAHALKKQPLKKQPMIKCKLCGQNFKVSFLLTHHVATHDNRKDNPCVMCGKTFETTKELGSHLKLHEEQNVTHIISCKVCGKRFTKRPNLLIHLRVHSGRKPHSCDFCGKTFLQKGQWEEHRRVHTGERPFVCETCGVSYPRKRQLTLHHRTSHTGERPFSCSFCHKRFKTWDVWKCHERIHTHPRQFSCQYCDRAFHQKDHMLAHSRIHTGEKPHVCNICGKGFSEDHNLKKHMWWHEKEQRQKKNKGKPDHPLVPGKPSAKVVGTINCNQDVPTDHIRT